MLFNKPRNGFSGLLIFPGIWDWYLQSREQRRGFYTKWEEDMLMVAQTLTRSEVGWVRQHPELLKHVRPIDGLIAPEEIEFASCDWHGACDAFHRHAANRSKEVQRACVFIAIRSSPSCAFWRPTARSRNTARSPSINKGCFQPCWEEGRGGSDRNSIGFVSKHHASFFP